MAPRLDFGVIGGGMIGASYSPFDGHVNPLALLRALHAAFIVRGGEHRPGWRVDSISRAAPGFTLGCGTERMDAERTVLAAAHSLVHAKGIGEGALPDAAAAFGARRFGL
jgi:glycine/D-amino acid oxidase-like deaminating enzyme